MTGLAVAGALVGALAAVAAAGLVWDRLRGRRTSARRVSEAESRYYRDGGDPTFGLDQHSKPFE